MIAEEEVGLEEAIHQVIVEEFPHMERMADFRPCSKRLAELLDDHHPREISEENPLLRPSTVAELFDVASATVKGWIRDGNLPAYKINVDSGRPEYRVLKSDMVAFAKRRYAL